MSNESLLVADAGPIIALAAIRRFEILHQLADEVIVPRAVFAEVIAGAPRAGAAELQGAVWVTVADGVADLVAAYGLLVDRGEAEALAIAEARRDSLLVIDDLRARRIARRLGLRFTGTLGILARGKRARLLDRVRPEVQRLADAGFRIDDSLRDAFLESMGE